MDRKLFVQAIVKVSLGILMMLALLFLPAGTFHYPGAWLLMGLLFIPMVPAGVVMMIKSPQRLRKRLNMRETEPEQKRVILMSLIMFIAGFAVAGISFRTGFLMLPRSVSIAGAVLFLLGYLLYALVIRENEYLSRTIEIQENQKVVDTGLYGVVRHPMYAATLLMFLSMPLILGSLAAFVLFLFYLPIIERRMRNEEAVLERGLEGYAEYKKKVKYRIIPMIW